VKPEAVKSEAVKIEALTRDHLPELAWLANRALDHDDLTVDLLRRRIFDDPDHDPSYSLGIWRDGHLVATAIGVIRNRQLEGRDVLAGFVRLFATDPRHRRQGLAAALLAELERRFAEAGCAYVDIGTEVPIWLTAGVDVRYTAALCFVQKHGYQKTRDTQNLEVDLTARSFDMSEQEKALAPKGYTFRRMQESDRPALDAYLSTRWSPYWRYEGLAALEVDPPTGHIALKDGEIVGFAVYDIARPGWFGPTGTNEELRGLGIGTILLHRCYHDWQLQGRKTGEVAWIGPMYFYSIASDARVCRFIWQFRKELPAG
jgi:GNAT superfamily N-acetyltransferase